MRPRFREDKATQAAGVLLRQAGGRMNYMKLIKLLYLADRAALLRRGRPITFDEYVAMKHGPVLSAVLDRINEGDPPDERSYWHRSIRRSGAYEVELGGEDFNPDRLSDAEEELLLEVFGEYGGMDRWELVELLHDTLPEWTDPGPTSVPISYRDILKAGGRTDAEVGELERELESLAMSELLVETGQ